MRQSPGIDPFIAHHEVAFVLDGERIVDVSGPVEELLGRSGLALLGVSIGDALAAVEEPDEEAAEARGGPILLGTRSRALPGFQTGAEVLVLSFLPRPAGD